jgi:hypothetical protein
MKIRQGFVSNSSTSSFVILGFKTNDDKYKSDDHLLLDDCVVVGDLIAYGSENDFPEREMSVLDLMNRAKHIAEKYGVVLSDVKLHTGIQACD